MTHVGFESTAPLAVEQIDHIRWRTTHDLVYHDGTGRVLTVPAGYITDFATVPRAFVGLVPQSGRHNPATILHDQLCDEALAGQFNRRDADWLFRQALRSLGVQPTRRWCMWAAVRWGALVAHPRQWTDFAHDLPAIAPLTLLALPAVTPAAVTTQLALLVIATVEAIERRVAGPSAYTTSDHRPAQGQEQPSMKWSEGLHKLRDVIENVDQFADASHATVEDALDTIRRMLNALDDTNDTELPVL